MSAFVSGGGNIGTSGSPTVNEGEVLIVGAEANDNAITKPGDFTTILDALTTGAGTDTGLHVGWKRAGPGGFTGTGTWSGADSLCWQIWSGLHSVTPIGAISSNVHGNTSGDPITFPALTLSTDWINTFLAAFCSRVSASLGIENAITGMVARSSDNSGAGGSSSVASKSTSAVRATDWPATDLTIGTNAKRIAVVFELLSADGALGGVFDGYKLGDSSSALAAALGLATDGYKLGDSAVVQAAKFANALDGLVLGDAAAGSEVIAASEWQVRRSGVWVPAAKKVRVAGIFVPSATTFY